MVCQLRYREALLVCPLTTCLALTCSLWESSLGFEPLDFELPSLNQGDARFGWVDPFGLVSEAKQSSWPSAHYFFFGLCFWFVFFITVAEICLCRKWPIKELPATKWFFVLLCEICLKATDCEGEIRCWCRFSALWSQLITWGLICVVLQHSVDTGAMKHDIHCLVCSHIWCYDTCFYKHWSGKSFPV